MNSKNNNYTTQTHVKVRTDKEKFFDFKKVIAIIQKNFIVISRDKVRIIPLMLFPVFMILVFGYTSGNIPKHISTVVVSYDDSIASQSILQEVSNSPVFAVKYVVSTEGEARKLLDTEKVRVIIEIPPDLENDINNGVQTGVTVIVDESDAAVAATAKQTMSAVVNKLSAQISAEKITYLQSTVGDSVLKLNGYISMESAVCKNYASISSLNNNAGILLDQSKKIIDVQTQGLIETSPKETSYVLAFSQTSSVNISENNTYLTTSASYDLAQAQISGLKSSSALISAAKSNVDSAKSIASNSNDALTKLSDVDSYNDNVVKPSNNILVFTKYSQGSLTQPLIYEEKPAYGTGKRAIDFAIPSIIALIIFQGAILGMGRAIAGEKREGSLTRVFLTPTSNATIIIGTLLFYIIFEMFRATFLIIIAMIIFDVHIKGSILAVYLILIIYAGVATSIGMILSSAVRTEQQFTAMAMLITLPSMFLSGAFFPVQAMPKFFQGLANFLPVTYAADALRGVMIKGFSLSTIILPIIILVGFLALSLMLVSVVFKRDIE